MIRKIIKLQGIGLLHTPLTDGAIELSETVAVYSDNGRGKSTLAAVFRSLRSGDVEELKARTTLGGTQPPRCEVLLEGGTCDYSGHGWSDTCDQILVFESRFIEDNVHAASLVGPAQRKGLLDFALGAEDVALIRAIEGCADEASGLDAPLRALKREIDRHAAGVPIDEFLALPDEDPGDEAIAVLSAAVADAENQTELLRRPLPRLLSIPTLDFAGLRATLAASIDSVSEDAQRQVTQHISEHLPFDDAEEWVRRGVPFAGETCPFCGQESKDVALLEAYRDYFNQSYLQLRERVDAEATTWERGLGDHLYDEATGTIADNSQAAIAWADHVNINIPEAPPVAARIRAVRHAIRAVLEAKRMDLLTSHPEAIRQSDIEEAWRQVAQQVSEYNLAIEASVQQIQELQATVAAADLPALDKRLQLLQVRRVRASVATECSEYRDLLRQKKMLADKKQELRDELERTSEALLRRYGEAVNARLLDFNAGFQLQAFNRAYAGDGVARAAYGLVVRGHDVPLAAPSGKPDFATTLSDGDKRLLALALFLARLDVDGAASEVTVVFDDPVCSFDIYRREKAADAICGLEPFPAQVIVLSHDPELIHLLAQKRFSQTLQIRPAGEGCLIEPCDIDEVLRDPYVKHYATLVSFQSGGAPAERLRSVAECIRPYLEANLTHRFPVELATCESLGKMIRRIRECAAGESLAILKDELDDLTLVNDFAVNPHHGGPDPDRIDERELQNMVGSALAIGWN